MDSFIPNVKVTIGDESLNLYQDESGRLNFPPLFGQDKLDRQKFWRIYVDRDCYYRESGIMNGAVRKYAGVQATPKNVGKSNETDGNTQAILEAFSLWKDKKRKSCYVQLLDNEAKEVKIDSNLTRSKSMLSPMLANGYTDRKHTVKFPCGVSPKVDGVRCFIYNKEGSVCIMSRGHKEYPFLDKVREQCKLILDEYDIVLDGELYSHNIPFNVISGAVRVKKKPHTMDSKLEFWIFDIVDEVIPYRERINRLVEIEKKFEGKLHNIKFIYYEPAQSHEEIDSLSDKYVKLGYEGIMIRDLESKYIQYRTDGLLKHKNFVDEEFKVVDVIECKGSTEAGAVIFAVQTTDGKQFTVRPRGGIGKRRWQLKNAHLYIGKMLTVRYQKSEEEVLPRFPVGVKFDLDTMKLEARALEAVDLRDYE